MRIGGVKYYRYCDDIITLSNDKAKLWYTKEIISAHIDRLQLNMKPVVLHKINNMEALDFLGYKVYSNRTLLRTAIKTKAMRTINKYNECSYKGWLQHCNGYNLSNKLTRRIR